MLCLNKFMSPAANCLDNWRIFGIMHTITFARSPSSKWEQWLVDDNQVYITRMLIQNRFDCLAYVEKYPKGVYTDKRNFKALLDQETGT